jgi:hypothetical protein
MNEKNKALSDISPVGKYDTERAEIYKSLKMNAEAQSDLKKASECKSDDFF